MLRIPVAASPNGHGTQRTAASREPALADGSLPRVGSFGKAYRALAPSLRAAATARPSGPTSPLDVKGSTLRAIRTAALPASEYS